MKVDLYNRDFLKLLDYTSEEIRYLLDLAKDFKKKKKQGIVHRYLEGKNVALLFEKTSTRTRCSFEVASYDLGMNVSFIDSKSSQMGAKESIKDTARVLSRLYDGIEYRGFSQEIVEMLALYSSVPVWNGLTDEFHPTQMLADLLTIEEKLSRLDGVSLTYMGDARNNMGNSLMIASAKMGLNFTACAPSSLFPSPALVEEAKKIAAKSGGSVTLEENPAEAVKNADVIYTDIWVSMGESDDVWENRIKLLYPYQVNPSLFAKAKDDAIFMHCLPSFHNRETRIGNDIASRFGINEMEVTDEIFESERSVVFDEAENRMHTIKAVMYATMKKN